MKTTYVLLAAFLLSSVVCAHASASEIGGFTIARLKYSGGGDWYTGRTALPNLLAGLKARAPVLVLADDEYRVSLLDEELFNYPMLFMTGHGKVEFSDAEVKRLRRYLTSGGFLWADDDYGMDQYFRKEMKNVLPDKELVELPFSHEIFHCFYDFPNGLPKIHEHDGKPPKAFALFHKGRMVVLYTYETDIGDGLEDPEVHGDPPDKREAAMRMAVNIVWYVLGY
jgi:hypothetical protein